MLAQKHRSLAWKEGKIFSIRLKDETYTLAQMAQKPYLICFNLFQAENIWNNLILTKKDVLFCHAVTRQFLQYSTVDTIKNIKPLLDFKLSTKAIFPGFFSGGYRKIDFKGRTRKVAVTSDKYLLAERDMLNYTKNTQRGLYHTVLIPEIFSEHWQEISGIEDTSIEIYPNLNERLYLCYKLGKNVNPALEINLGMPVPDDYETYVDIISGTVDLEELGY